MSFFALAAIGLFIGQAPVAQDTASRLESLRQELAQRQAAIADLDNRAKSLSESLAGLDESIARLQDERRATDVKLLQLNTSVAALQVVVDEHEAKLATLRTRLEARMRALYISGDGAVVRALLGAESFEDSAIRRRFLRSLTDADARLLDDYEQARRAVSQKRDVVAAALLDASFTSTQIAEQERLVVTAREERARAIDRILSERVLLARITRELAMREAGLAALLGRLMESPAPMKKARTLLKAGLAWPADGVLIRRFGVVVDKDSRAEIMSNGIEIRANAGDPVRAVAAGHVAFVGTLRGFGRIVIVDHGEGHHTLSAHLERALVAVGDDVDKGQAIGAVGDTESLNGPKLYFELRDNGRPRDPMPFLRK